MKQTHARKTDPITSHKAAERNARVRHTQVHEVVYWLGSNRATTAEVAAMASAAGAKNMDRWTVGRRMPDAERQGYVRRVGERKCTVVRSDCVIWMRTDKKLPREE